MLRPDPIASDNLPITKSLQRTMASPAFLKAVAGRLSSGVMAPLPSLTVMPAASAPLGVAGVESAMCGVGENHAVA